MNQKGNILIISMIFVAIAITIFTFIIMLTISHTNNILYNFKLEMYSMNKTAIIAVNKNKANIDNFSYNKNVYEKEFIKLLKQNYKLDNNLSNGDKLISNIEIKEYEIYEKNKKDNYTKEKCDDRTIHTVLKVKIKPIIMRKILEDVFVFTVHEDVNLNMVTEF